MNQDPMTQEEYEKQKELLGLGTQNANLEDAIKMQMAQAAALRHGGAPQLREAGKLVVAPHWMELLGSLAKEKVAGDLSRSSSAKQAIMRGNENTQKEALLAALYKQQQMAQPNAAPGMLTPGLPGGQATGMVPGQGSPGEGMVPPPNAMQMPQLQTPYRYRG